MKYKVVPTSRAQLATTSAMNSGPLSHLMKCGLPLSASRSSSTATTSAALIDRLAIDARASLEYSSMMFRIFTTLVSLVWSNWKSSAQMTFSLVG